MGSRSYPSADKLSSYSTAPRNRRRTKNVGEFCIHLIYLQLIFSAFVNKKSFYFNLILIKQSDGKAPVILELWEMQSIPSLPSLPGPLWSGVVAPDKVLSLDEIELFDI